jgi:hypothetical protein
VGTVITGIKSIAELGSGVWRNLNPWHVTFCLFALMLLALGVVHLVEKLDARFTQLSTELQNGLRKEGESRGGEHAWVLAELQARDSRLSKLEAKPSSAKDFVRPA